MTVDPKIYGAEYYRSSNYADYMERADRYKKTAYELVDLLRKLNLIQTDSNILDYGCAIGFLIEGFKELGYRNVIGVEVSEWAKSEAEKRGHRVYPNPVDIHSNHPGVDIMTALDVFEHMTDEQITETIRWTAPSAIVARIPSSTDGGKTFHLEVSRQDPTHINCKTKAQWISFFRTLGYNTFLKLNLYTVYDTPGVTCLLML